MKVITVRLPDELNRQVTEFAKQEDMSKNQVIKKAIRRLLIQQQNEHKTN